MQLLKMGLDLQEPCQHYGSKAPASHTAFNIHNITAFYTLDSIIQKGKMILLWECDSYMLTQSSIPRFKKRGSYFPLGEWNQQPRRKRKRKEGGKKICNHQNAVSFLPCFKRAMYHWNGECLRENATSLKQTHSHFTSAPKRLTKHVSLPRLCLLLISSRHFSHLEWRERRRAQLPGGSTFSHVLSKPACHAERTGQLPAPASYNVNKWGGEIFMVILQLQHVQYMGGKDAVLLIWAAIILIMIIVSS